MLHGNVLVNSDLIGYWMIVRQEPLEFTDDEYTYDWKYFQYPTTEGEKPASQGAVKHRYSEGAPALIAKVMTEVSKVVKMG